jgi:RHS repeat-associated protein
MSTMDKSIFANLDYLPFGEINSTDSGITTHEFTGDERDSETSLDHTWFRQYSSQFARWTSPDPAGLAAVDPSNPQSWNRYAYVGNNPMNFTDPNGLCVHMLFDDATCADGYYFGGALPTTCVVDGADAGCGQLFQLFNGDKFAVLKAALAPTSMSLVGDTSKVCIETGDCGAGYISYQYGNLGLLAFLGAGTGGNTTGGGNSSGGAQQPAPSISPAAQACVNQANQQVQNQLQTFSGYAGTKVIGRAALGAFSGALTSFGRFSKTGNPWVVVTGAVVGASIGAGTNILSDVFTIRKIQNSFMDKFVACTQNASIPKPPE